MDLPTAARLRSLLYGDRRAPGIQPAKGQPQAVRCFNEEWLTQGLYFCDTPGLRYGLVQARGGPCGVIAPVQAEVIRHLYYSEPSLFDGPCAAAALHEEQATGAEGWRPHEAAEVSLDPSDQQRQRALVLVLSDMIWRARPAGSNVAVVATCEASSAPRGGSTTISIDGKSVVYKPDGITERAMLHTCNSITAVAAVIESNLSSVSFDDRFYLFITVFCAFVQYARPESAGVPLLVYSVALTRGGAGAVRSDFDDPGTGAAGTLIGDHDYATQVPSVYS
jgi:hypothetical protein